MKGIFYVLFTILVVSCGSDQKLNTSFKNDDLIALVNSKTELGDPSADEYDSEWIPVQSRKEMLTSFFNNVKNREYEVFEFFPGEMTAMKNEELSYFFHHVDTELVENELGDYVPIMMEETFDPSGIVYFKFKEELYYNDESGKFSKKVKYVCPMEKMYEEDGSLRGYRGLFWVKIGE